MTAIVIISKDNKRVELSELSFAEGLNFARSFNKRTYNKVLKVWNVSETHANIIEELGIYTFECYIYEFLQECNNKYGGHAAYGGIDSAYTYDDIIYYAKQAYKNPDSIHEIELDILSEVDNHICNYR